MAIRLDEIPEEPTRLDQVSEGPIRLDQIPKRPPFGFAPGKELDPEGFGTRPEPTYGDPSLPKAGITDVPGIAGRGLVSAELGVAKSILGT